MINKNCSFSKFNDLMGIHQIIFDSLLEDQTLTEAVNNVKELYLKKYYGSDLAKIGTTNEEIRAFLGDVASSIYSAIEDDEDVDEVEAHQIITEQVSAWADSLYKTEVKIENIETRTEADEIEATNTSGRINTPIISDSVFLQANLIEEGLNFKIDRISNARDIAQNYFKSASIAYSDLGRSMFNQFFKASFIDLSQPTNAAGGPKPVTNSTEVDRNLKNYKSSLYKLLFPGEELYVDGNSIPNLSAKLREFENSLDSINGGAGIYVQNLITWVHTNDPKIQQYYALISLKHFDQLVDIYGRGLVTVKKNLVGNYSEAYTATKYIPANTAMMRTGYTNEELTSIIQETTPLFRTMVETTNVINLDGQRTRSYLRQDQIYFAMSKLKNRLDKDEPAGSIKKAVVQALEDYFSGASKLLTTGDVKVLLSVYQRFFSDTATNNQLKKNRNLNSIINNIESLNESSIAQVYHSHISSKANLNLLDVVGAHITKIDLMNYGEVSMDYGSKEPKSYTLKNKLRDRQFNMIKALGKQSASATQYTLDSWKSNFGITTDDEEVTFNLGESQVVYNIVNQSFRKPNGDDFDFASIDYPVDLIDLNQPELSAKYSDYKHVLDMFSSVASQPLNALNFEIPQVLRDNYGASHVKDLLVIAGNLVYTSHLKVNHLKGLKDMSRGQINNALKSVYGLLRKYPFAKLWNSAGFFNIDFGETSFQAIRNYSDALNEVHGSNIKSTTLNASGSAIPTYTLSRMINDLKSVVNLMRNNNPHVIKPGKDYSIPLADNIFVTNTADDLLKRVEVRLTFKALDGTVIPSSKLTDVETVMYDIINDYAEQKMQPDELERNPKFQATNYADKSQHAAIVINGDADITINGETKKYRDFTTKDYIDHFYFTQKSYYDNLWSTVADDYSTLFKSGTLYQTYLNSETKVLKEAIKATKESNPEFDELGRLNVYDMDLTFMGTTLSKEVETYNKLYDAFEDSKEYYSVKEINELIGSVSEKTLSIALSDADIPNIKTLMYESDPETKKNVVNRTITHFKNVYNNGVAKHKIERERAFLKGLLSIGFTLDAVNDKTFTPNSIINRAATHWKMDAFYDDKIGRYDLYKGDLDSDTFTINPMLKQYLWERNLSTENFQNATVGTIAGHPHKVKQTYDKAGKPIKITDEEIISARSIAMFKRMVIHQATFHPYSLNQISGIPFFGKVAYIKDPSSPVFSPFGVQNSVDITDGATYNLPLLTRLQNNSLLDQVAGVTQKSIGGGLDRKYNSAELLKHAAHSITNERLRNENADSKFSYAQLVRKGMSEDFNVGGFKVKMDISKDFNNNEIILDDIGVFDDVSFISEDTGEFLSVGRITPAPGTWLTDNEYHVTYRDMVTGKMLDPRTVQIQNLHDLWQVLGGKNSISYDPSQENANLNGTPQLKGYVYSDRSWDALAEYVNRAAVWFDDQAISRIIDPMDADLVKPEDIKAAYNERVINPKSTNQNFNASNSSPNQKTVIQPLKQSFIGQFTFSSGQKVGVQNENPTNVLNRGDSTPLRVSAFTSNLHTGIQLNADHETEDSTVTEPTQITNTLNFNGDTPEYAQAAYKAIYRYIDNSLSKVLPDIDKIFVLPEAKYRVYNVIAKELLSSFSEEETGTMAGSILTAVKTEMQKYETELRLLAKANPTSEAYTTALMAVGNYDEEGFKLPFSDSNLYGTFSTTIANFFTKEGIRRKLPGMAAVISPYSGFFGMRTVTDLNGETQIVNEEGYKTWRRKMENNNPTLNAIEFAERFEEIPITEETKHTIEIFDTVKDASGKKIYLDTPDKYYNFKMSKGNFTHMKTASRDLKPTIHKWEIAGVKGSVNYFDLALSKLTFLNEALQKEINKLVQLAPPSKRGVIDNKDLSVFEIERDGNRSQIALEQFQRVQSMITQYNDMIKMANVVGDIKPYSLDLQFNENGPEELWYEYSKPAKVAFNDDTKRLLKNELSQVLTTLHADRLSPLPITTLYSPESLAQFNIVTDQDDKSLTKNALEAYQEFTVENPEATVADWILADQPLVAITKFTTEPGEIIMPAINANKYGISSNDQVHDISESFFYERAKRLSLPDPSVPHDFYLQSSTGEHLYILLAGSDDFNKADLNEVRTEKVTEPQPDGTNRTFKIDSKGDHTYELGYENLYESLIAGKIRNYIVVNDLDELKRVTVMSKGKNSPYSSIIPNFSAGLKTAELGAEFMVATKAENGQKYANRLEKIKKDFGINSLNDKNNIVQTKTAATGLELLGMYDSEWAAKQLGEIKARIAKLNSEAKSDYNETQMQKASVKATKVAEYLQMIQEYEAAPDEETKQTLGYALVATSEYFKHNDIMSANNAIDKILTTLQKSNSAIDSEFRALNAFQYSNMNKENRRKAKETFSSFKVQLNVTAARIPGQHMQSYMGQKIVGFVHTEGSLSFVSPFHMWITGEDFDIDKVFITQYSVDDSGKLIGWGKMFNYDTPETLRKSLELPLPDGKLKEFTDKPFLTKTTLEIKDGEAIHNYLTNGINFNGYVAAMKKIGDAEVIYTPPFGQWAETGAYDQKLVIDHIKSYFLEQINDRYAKEATLNVLVNSINGSINDIRNVNAQYSPVDFGKAGDAAADSSKGQAFKQINPLNPVDIAKAKNANMIGKEVIGISATGLKVYSALSNAFVKIKEKGGDMGILLNHKVKTFEKVDGKVKITGTRDFAGIAGINYTNNVDEYLDYYVRSINAISMVPLNQNEIDEARVNIVQQLRYREDVALDLSALLSAATDNAKELILGRINAGPETVSFYVAGLMYGYDFASLATMMTSPEADAMIALAGRNLYTGRKGSIDKALTQLENGYLDPTDYFDYNTACVVVDQLKLIPAIDAAIKQKWKMPYINTMLKNPFKYIEAVGKVFQLNAGKGKIENRDTIVGDYSIAKVKMPMYLSPEEAEAAALMAAEFQADEAMAALEIQEAGGADQGYDEYPADYNPEAEYFDYDDATRTVRTPVKPMIFAEIAFNRYMEANDKFVINTDKDILTSLQDFNEMSSDIKVLGQMLSINQSIKVTDYDLYKYFKNISEHTAKNVNDDPDKAKRFAVPIPKYQWTLDNLDDFDKFVSDPEFRKNVINSHSGKGLNTLAVLVESDHFFKMFELGVKTDVLKNAFSSRNRLVRNIATDISAVMKSNGPLSRGHFGAVSSFASEVIINNFLNGKKYSIDLRAGDFASSDEPLEAAKTVIIDSMEGQLDFINWFENTVIPDLKSGKIRDVNNNYLNVPVVNIKENLFLQLLGRDTKKDITNGQTYSFLKLPFDMNGALNEDEKVRMDDIITAFATLRNHSYGGKKLLDLLYLYNLIVNKNKNTAQSFNRLFDAVSEEFNNESVMTDFVKFESALDWDGVDLTENNHYQIADLVNKGVVKIVETLPLLGDNADQQPDYVAIESWNETTREKERKVYYKDRNNYVLLNSPVYNNKIVNVHNGGENLINMVANKAMELKQQRLLTFLDNIELKQLDCN